MDGSGGPVLLGAPLLVDGLFQEATGKGWGKVLSFADPAGETQRISLLDGEITTNWTRILARLLNAGYQLGPAPDAAKRLQRLLKLWRLERRYGQVDRIGVHLMPEPCFVLASGRVIGGTDLIADASATSAARDMGSIGTLDDWRRDLSSLCVGNPLMVLAVSLAFFGPVLGLVHPDMAGGFHLGGASSRGKSTIAEMAASVWGGPRLRRSWNTTADGIEALAAAHSGTLLILDEIGEASPKVIGQAIHALSNGSGKARMTSETALRSGEPWALAFLSTGERGIASRLAEIGLGVMAGQSVRLIEVPADLRRFGAFDDLHDFADGAAFADAVKARRLRAHGTAGPAFVEALFADLAPSVERIGDLARTFTQRMRASLGSDPDGQVLRVLKRCAHVAAAGELATEFGLTAWPSGAAMEALAEVFEDWLASRDDGATATEVHVQKVRAWFAGHPTEIADLPGTHPAARAWRDTERVYLLPEVWAEIHGPNHLAVSRTLQGAGILERGEDRNMAARAPRAIPGRPRVYRLKRSCLQLACGEETAPLGSEL